MLPNFLESLIVQLLENSIASFKNPQESLKKPKLKEAILKKKEIYKNKTHITNPPSKTLWEHAEFEILKLIEIRIPLD